MRLRLTAPCVLGLAILSMLLAPTSARAVILYQSETRDTSAPTGAFANSGWQYEGEFGGHTATAISKKFIITAGHLQHPVGTNFVFNGELHRTVQVWGDPTSDLRIYQVVGSLFTVAPFVKDGREGNRTTMIFGRGTQRGDPVTVNGVLKGWQWGTSDSVLSWGRNAITNIAKGQHGEDLLRMTFDANGGSNEGMITGGDSGGGVFVKQGTLWKLAGVNFSVDGPFSYNQDGSGSFSAAIFDRSQLWTNGYGFDSSNTVTPAASYATRTFPRLTWISDVLNGRVAPGVPDNGNGGAPTPEPAAGVLVTSASFLLISRRRRRRD